MKTFRSRAADGSNVNVLEAEDLQEWSHAVVGRLTLRIGIGAVIVIATAAVMWTRLVIRVEAAESKINTLDVSGTQHERNLETRLQRIEWLLEGLPDSIAVRVLQGRRP